MIKFWLNKAECTGCAACANVCPKQAIVMEEDVCGFEYPVVSDRCVNCGVCKRVCERRLKMLSSHAKRPDAYAVWSKDSDTRFESTSGGAFSELAKVMLAENGCVSGAKYVTAKKVEHSIIDDIRGLESIRQSKYVQSSVGSVYKDIENKLRTGEKLLFCGSPCQVSALYAVLGKSDNNLITADFICRGVNSPKAYRAWLEEIENKEKKQVARVWFKYKVNGWKKSPRCTRLDFVDGSYVVQDQAENLYMCGYLESNLYIRPSCGDCQFKGLPRQADITLADFWGVDRSLDDDKGTSMVLINSDKGRTLFDKARVNFVTSERWFAEILSKNAYFDRSVEINSRSEMFLRSLDTLPFSMALKKYGKQSLRSSVRQKIKSAMKRILGKS